MLDQIAIIEYAIKGIYHEIEELDKAVRKGSKLLEAYYKGEIIKSNLTIHAIEEIYKKKKTEIAMLEEMKNELQWKLVELEEK